MGEKTYKRDNILANYLRRYAIDMPKEVPELHKIYIVRMNVEHHPSDSSLIMANKDKWNVEVEFIIPPKNDLNYRLFIPQNSETEAIFTSDDDLIIKPRDIQKAFYQLKDNFDGNIAPITGFVQRDYAWNIFGEYEYFVQLRSTIQLF